MRNRTTENARTAAQRNIESLSEEIRMLRFELAASLQTNRRLENELAAYRETSERNERRHAILY